jgi:hypothetical protein
MGEMMYSMRSSRLSAGSFALTLISAALMLSPSAWSVADTPAGISMRNRPSLSLKTRCRADA